MLVIMNTGGGLGTTVNDGMMMTYVSLITFSSLMNVIDFSSAVAVVGFLVTVVDSQYSVGGSGEWDGMHELQRNDSLPKGHK
jgi:hypothetical protein